MLHLHGTTPSSHFGEPNHIAEEYGYLMMVDDAHGEGVLGHGGRGIVDHFKLHGKVDVEVGTLSKAFGVMGGVVAGKQSIVDWLRQRGRPFLFSSAMTVPDTAACLAAVDLLEESTDLVDRLCKFYGGSINCCTWNDLDVLIACLNQAFAPA